MAHKKDEKEKHKKGPSKMAEMMEHAKKKMPQGKKK